MEQTKHTHDDVECRQRIEDLKREDLDDRKPGALAWGCMIFFGLCALAGIILTALF